MEEEKNGSAEMMFVAETRKNGCSILPFDFSVISYYYVEILKLFFVISMNLNIVFEKFQFHVPS